VPGVYTRASAKKFPGGPTGKKSENSTIKLLPEGEKQRKKGRKMAKKAENSLYLLYCAKYENPGEATAPFPPLLTPMSLHPQRKDLFWESRRFFATEALMFVINWTKISMNRTVHKIAKCLENPRLVKTGHAQQQITQSQVGCTNND